MKKDIKGRVREVLAKRNITDVKENLLGKVIQMWDSYAKQNNQIPFGENEEDEEIAADSYEEYAEQPDWQELLADVD